MNFPVVDDRRFRAGEEQAIVRAAGGELYPRVELAAILLEA